MSQFRDGMKRGKRIIAYFLVVVSMLVLMITVFPHHHHGLHFCPITLCEQCHTWGCSYEHETNEQETGGETCKSTCVTQFHYLTPTDSQHQTDADYTFFTLIYPLFKELESLLQVEDDSKPDLYYLEKLHARLFHSSVGLRAPPFMVLI